MASVDELVDSLLYEGYALYPYTPDAAKNATPTPFGIVYPPAYAATSSAAFDHLRMECLVAGGAEVTLACEVRFLQSSGDRHRAEARRIDLEPVSLGDLSEMQLEHEDEFGSLVVRVVLEADLREDGLWLASMSVANLTRLEDGAGELGRAEALVHSLISTHPILRANGGSFVSPLESRGCNSVNTWPVLATDDEDSMLGTTIILPDHPEIAPQSRGNLFDNTEIEEALLLHVHALSEAERDAIETQDPAVRAMIERALKVGHEEMAGLHGVFTPAGDASGETSRRPPGAPNDVPGEEEVTVKGRQFARGGKVVLRLGERRDVYDRMLNGREATIERIYRDYDDKVYLGVTVDSDPMQEVFRESGRYLFFFADEVEVLPG